MLFARGSQVGTRIFAEHTLVASNKILEQVYTFTDMSFQNCKNGINYVTNINIIFDKGACVTLTALEY
jgi:hypothetical protein